MAVSRSTAHNRKLQGEHSNHHTASGVPDRAVKTQTEASVAAGSNPSPKTALGSTGVEPAADARDTAWPGAVDGKTGNVDTTASS